MKKLIVVLAALLLAAVPLIGGCGGDGGGLTEAEEHYNKGCEYGLQGCFDDAIAQFSKAIELDPQFASAYAYRALAYTGLGNKQQAERDIHKAVELGANADLLREMVEAEKAQR
jgi:tetratricopeptide (TPR) repeat protein